MRVVTTNKRMRNKHHNDRTFDTVKAQNIDDSRVHKNLGYTWDKSKTMDEAEQNFYEQYFQKGLDAKNARYVKSGHKERVKTIEQMRSDTKTCPEEGIKQIGKVGDTIDENLAIKILSEYVQWKAKSFTNCVLLDAYIHLDESTPHMHERSVYFGHDKDGNLIPNQSKALKEMGIERPDKTKPESRYNNAKITFDKMCRDKFIEICQSHGVVIEKDPKERNKSGLSLVEYKARQEEQKAQKAIEEAQKANQVLGNAVKALEGVEIAKSEAIRNKDEAEKMATRAYEQVEALKKESELLKQENDIQKDIFDAYKSDMGSVPPKILKEIPEKKNFRGQIIEEACVVVPKKAYQETVQKAKIYEAISRMQKQTQETYDKIVKLLNSSEVIQRLKDRVSTLTQTVQAHENQIYSLGERLKRRENDIKTKENEINSYRDYLSRKGLLGEYERTMDIGYGRQIW